MGLPQARKQIAKRCASLLLTLADTGEIEKAGADRNAVYPPRLGGIRGLPSEGRVGFPRTGRYQEPEVIGRPAKIILRDCRGHTLASDPGNILDRARGQVRYRTHRSEATLARF